MESFVSANPLEKLKEHFSDLLHSPAWSGLVDFTSVDSEGIVVQVASPFARDWVQENYSRRLKEFSRQELGCNGTVRFVVIPLSESLPPHHTPSPSLSPFKEVPPSATPNPKGSEGQSAQARLLNPKYQFASFVVGSSNQFAHAAALAVSERPAESYNPLFIYGGVGLGKTHLMHAVGQKLGETHPGIRILYVSSEKFVNEVIHSIRSGRMNEFRHKYRESCDILLMDDVQFIAGKERSQEEFFHTFNFLHEMHKQIVLTSDRPPKDIHELEGRVRSRLEWGLIADIQPPDLETRVAIVLKKAKDNQIPLPEEVALFLATHIKSNIRELEGALIRVYAFASLHHKPITVDFAKETLKNVLGGIGRVMTVDQIQKVVGSFYGVSVGEITGKCRVKSHAHPRQVAMYLCRKFVKASFPEIGTKFGGKDHSTVVHAVTKITSKLDEDSDLREQVLSIERQLSH